MSIEKHENLFFNQLFNHSININYFYPHMTITTTNHTIQYIFNFKIIVPGYSFFIFCIHIRVLENNDNCLCMSFFLLKIICYHNI